MVEIVKHDDSTNLFIFPETVLKKNLAIDYVTDIRIQLLLKYLRPFQTVVFGAARDFERYENSICFLNTTGLRRIEKKHYLLGSEFPIENLSSLIEYYKHLWNSKIELFKYNGIKIKPLICYDACFPFWNESKIDLYIQITEEQFFNKSYAQYLYHNQTIIRSIESQKPIIRCSNGGKAGVYFPNRKVLKDSYSPIYIFYQ